MADEVTNSRIANNFFQDFKTYNIPMVLEEALLKQREILFAKFLFESKQVCINPWLVLKKQNIFNPSPHNLFCSPESCRQTRES